MQTPIRRPRFLTRLAAPAVLLAVGALAPNAAAQEDAFTLASAIPGDVFLMTEGRYNPERKFLEDYWNEVWVVFQESGIIDDAVQLVMGAADEEERQEMTRIYERFMGLCTATDWAGLGSGEVAFAERLPLPIFLDGGPGVVTQAEMVAIFRTDAESAGAYYAALRAILEAVIEEINGLADLELKLDEVEQAGLTSVVFRLSQIDPDAPDLSISLGHQRDLVVMTFGSTIGDDVAGLLMGTSEKPSVADNLQYRDALASLPAAEDGYEFVDLQVLRVSLDKFMDATFEKLLDVDEGELAENVEAARAVADRLIGILDAFAYSATVHSTDGYAVYDHSITVLAEDAKQNPFYPVLVGGNPVTNFAQYLPQETVSYAVGGSTDLDALYTYLEATVLEAGEAGEQIIAMWNAIQEEHDFNVAEDILSWVDGASVSASFRDGDSDAWISMMKVKDEERAREKVSWALGKIPVLLEDLTALNPMLAMFAMTVKPTSAEGLEGFHDVSFGMLAQSIPVGVRDGWLVMGSSSSAVLVCQATAAGEHPSVLENKDLMARALLPEGPADSVTFTDHSGDAEEGGDILRTLSMVGTMVSAAVPEPEAQKAIGMVCGILGKLAPVVEAIDFYDSSSTVTTFDGKAWHVQSVTHYVAPDVAPDVAPEEPESGD